MMSIIAGLVVSVDALFIGISLGLQEKCKYIYLVIINVFLLGLCFLGYFIAGQVYELIPVDPDYIVGFAFIALGAGYIISYYIKTRVKKEENQGSNATIATVGVVMSLEAMLITMGITMVFMPNATLLIPITVALAHFVYSTVTFFLARTKQVQKMPVALSHVLSGAGLIIYGLMAIFLEIEIY